MNIDYLLLSKKPIQVTKNLFLYQHTMEEIEQNIGYEFYQTIVYSSTREPYEFKYLLEKMNVDYKDVTYMRLFFNFCMSEEMVKWNNIEIKQHDLTIFTLNFMFDADFELADLKLGKKDEVNNIGFRDRKTQDILSVENFNQFKNVLSKMFFITPPKERFAINNMAKELIMRQSKLKQKDSIDHDIYSIISSLLWSPNCKETHESIWGLSPYQIYNGYLTVEKIKNFDNTMGGYYAGNIGKDDLKINKIHWTKKIS